MDGQLAQTKHKFVQKNMDTSCRDVSHTCGEKEVIALNRTSPRTPLKYFQVFGERRSGTNFVSQVISRNTLLEATSRFGWKHGIPMYPVFPESCLFVVVVRDPFEWLKAIYRAPFHATASLWELSFSEFIRAEWETVYTPVQSGWEVHGYNLDFRLGPNEVLQLDRHPTEGRRFHNVIEMRNVKLSAHLSFLNRDLNCSIVQYEEVQNNVRYFLTDLSVKFNVALHESTDPVHDRVGPKTPRPTVEAAISRKDRDFILRCLNRSQEEQCGYIDHWHKPGSK